MLCKAKNVPSDLFYLQLFFNILLIFFSPQIAVNSTHCWQFPHRISFSRVSSIFIDGSVQIERIEYIDKITPVRSLLYILDHYMSFYFFFCITRDFNLNCFQCKQEVMNGVGGIKLLELYQRSRMGAVFSRSKKKSENVDIRDTLNNASHPHPPSKEEKCALQPLKASEILAFSHF